MFERFVIQLALIENIHRNHQFRVCKSDKIGFSHECHLQPGQNPVAKYVKNGSRGPVAEPGVPQNHEKLGHSLQARNDRVLILGSDKSPEIDEIHSCCQQRQNAILSENVFDPQKGLSFDSATPSNYTDSVHSPHDLPQPENSRSDKGEKKHVIQDDVERLQFEFSAGAV